MVSLLITPVISNDTVVACDAITEISERVDTGDLNSNDRENEPRQSSKPLLSHIAISILNTSWSKRPTRLTVVKEERRGHPGLCV